MMVWGAIGYNMRSHLLPIHGNLNSKQYIKEVLEREVLPHIQATPHSIFQQYNVQPHSGEECIGLLGRTTVSLLTWPARSIDMWPIEHVLNMVGRQLDLHGPQASTLDTL